LLRHARRPLYFGKMFWKKHELDKRYLALSARSQKKKRDRFLGGMQRQVGGGSSGSFSQIVENFGNYAVFFGLLFKGYRLLYSQALTGKTHQDCVALKEFRIGLF